MDIAEIIADVISSGAIITATYHIVKGLKTRLKVLEKTVAEQRDYINEIRIDFKELNSIKSQFIQEFSNLHVAYKDHAEKTYNEIIEIKETEIAVLKSKTMKKFTEKATTIAAMQQSISDKTK